MNLLTPFGKLYGSVMDLRNLLYDRDVLKSYQLGARTISVGNLTTGGTGKTPLVALIAKLLIDDGETICILTRGYGRKGPGKRVLVSDGANILADADTGGDEPVELAHKLGGKVIIVADRDRVAAALWAREKFKNISTFILDDGFQHRRARRDLDILCIDATNPCGNGRILPAGTLRESFNGLKRANAIIITRTEQVDSTSDLEQRLRMRNSLTPIFKARTELKGLVTLDEFHSGSQNRRLPNDKLFAFTAIANSENFLRTLTDANCQIVGIRPFRDHHQFTQSDIGEVEKQAREKKAAALVTTAKDAVKLHNLHLQLPCYAAIADPTINDTAIDDPGAFRDLILDDRR